jgi:hypothetical protein
VRRWKRDGVPKERASQVKLLDVAKRHEGYEEKSLREMMKLAEEDGKLIKVKNYARTRDGEKTTGYEVSKAGHGFLNEASLLKLRTHLESQKLAKGLPHWLASVTVSAFIEDAEKGLYMGKIVQVDHPDANQFVSEAIISSGLQDSRQGMIDAMINSLRKKMKESDAKFYLHGSYLSTYKYKSEQESRDLQTDRRRNRRLASIVDTRPIRKRKKRG